MKIINYEELFGEFKPDGAISTDANLIANALMRELYISSGHNLARFEPPRLYRRVIYLSQAAMPDRIKLS